MIKKEINNRTAASAVIIPPLLKVINPLKIRYVNINMSIIKNRKNLFL